MMKKSITRLIHLMICLMHITQRKEKLWGKKFLNRLRSLNEVKGTHR